MPLRSRRCQTRILRRKRANHSGPGLRRLREGPGEKTWGRRAQTWGRAEARRDYLLGALCPMPSVRDICECRILFVPLMLISKAHTVLLITGLKNVSCCCVIAFYKFKSVAVI